MKPVETEEAFDDDDGAGSYWFCIFQAGVGNEAVARLLDGEAEFEAFDVADEQGSVEGIGVIEVEIRALWLWDVGAINVVMIKSKGEGVVEELAGEAAGELCFAGATGSGDADEERAHGYGLRSLSRAAWGMSFQLPEAVVGKDFFLV